MKNFITILGLAFLISTAGMLHVSADDCNEKKINQYIIEISEDYYICPELIMAMVEKESMYNPFAENGSCIGLMQINEKWHADRMERLGVTDLYDPYSNILVGVDYIAELAEEYEDIGLVLMMYNMKHDTAFNLYEQGILSKYAESILERSAELERLHGK